MQKRPETISGVYKITSTVSGRTYVGSATKISQRWNEHLSDLRKNRHHSSIMQRSFNRNGEKSLVFSILEAVDDVSKLVEREQYFIDTLRSYVRHGGFNVCPVARSCLGMRHSKETRNKIALAKRGKKLTPEVLARFRERAKERIISIETRLKISIASKRKRAPRTEEHCRKLSEAQKGKLRGPQSPEHRDRIRAAILKFNGREGELPKKILRKLKPRYVRTLEHARKLRESQAIARERRREAGLTHKGVPWSEERRRKRSAQMREQWRLKKEAVSQPEIFI